MQILFSADWHIKLGQKNVPVDWAINRYEMFFTAILHLEDSCDLHIIGGDLFDRMPSLEELALYYNFISRVTIPTIIYDGNHEATKKHRTFFEHLKEVSRAINPKVEIVTETKEYSDFSILPYCDLKKKGIFETLNTSKPLFTHVRGEIPPHVKPEINLDLLDPFPIVFAGDLHSHSCCQRNIHYPGSPMTTTFHREEVETGVMLIDSSTWTYEWKALELPQLLRKTIKSPEDLIPTEYHHTIYEIEGNLQDLSQVQTSDLLDKKLVRRNNEASLLLSSDMSMVEKLEEYLRYVLELPDANIKSILKVYNDLTQNAGMG